MRLLNRLFYDVAYGIGIRRSSDINSDAPYFSMLPSLFEWYADPFVFNYNGEDYLFFESFNYHEVYGKICCGKIIDNHIVDVKVVIQEPFHMSFPNVFEYQGNIYMLPETKQTGELRLYICDAFPYSWVLDSVLLSDVKLVDHALYLGKDNIVISYDVSNDDKKNRYYKIDFEKKVAEEFFPKGEHTSERAGGSFFTMDNRLFRSIQNCEKTYGDYLKIFEVSSISETEITEKEVMQIHADDIVLIDNPGINHCHTYNRNENYEVVDFRYDKFFPNKVFRRLWINCFLKKRTINRHL